ncbi:MAG: carbohydrate kinase [Roseobacter sp.]
MILCCGEALIDMIPAQTAAGGHAFQPHAGGAIFNTAIALGRLGVDTGFVSGLSTDLFGQQLRDALDHSHVHSDHAVISDKPTTLAFVELNDGHATYTFYDENTAGRSLTPDMIPDLPASVDALYFGGISLISEPCADFYLALATRAHADHVVMLDPNIRAGFIKDEASYRRRLEQMIALADIVKVSDEDLDWIVPGAGTLEEKAKTLGAEKFLVVTRGSKGALGYLPGGSPIEVEARTVDMVDTVGAGDTFNAGVLAALARAGVLTKKEIRRLTPEDGVKALAYGASVAAITVSRAGANPPWAHEIDETDLIA